VESANCSLKIQAIAMQEMYCILLKLKGLSVNEAQGHYVAHMNVARPNGTCPNSDIHAGDKLPLYR
jgi:hypothetical protein